MSNILITQSQNNMFHDCGEKFAAVSGDLLKKTIILRQLMESIVYPARVNIELTLENRNITNNFQKLSWKNGEIFFFCMAEAGCLSDKDIATSSLVCKGWKNVINSNEFYSILLKNKAPIYHQSLTRLSNVGLDWKSACQSIIIKDRIEKKLVILSNLKTSAILLIDKNKSKQMDLEKYFNLIEHIFEDSISKVILLENKNRETRVWAILTLPFLANLYGIIRIFI